MNRYLLGILAALMFTAAASAANVVEYRFYNRVGGSAPAGCGGTHTAAAPDSAALALPSDGTVSGICAPEFGVGDRLGEVLTYNIGGVQMVADSSGTGTTSTIQDLSPVDGGIGANGGTARDNIGIGEWVDLIFERTVGLLGFFAYSDHLIPANNFTFRISVDGGAFVQYTTNGANWIDLNLTGSTFRFAFDDACFNDGEGCDTARQFYISAIRVDVPEPETLALLGLGLLGFGLARRRKAA